MPGENAKQLLQRIHDLEQRLEASEETLRAIRTGEIDAVVVSGPEGERVYSLKGADEPYRIMVQKMAEGALTTTPEGLILFSNEQFASMLGVPLDRVIGSRLHDFIVPEDSRHIDALLTGSESTRKAEIRLVADARRLVPAQLSASGLLFDGTKGVCVVVTDLTEQKRNEEIVAAERLARSILEEAAGAILVTDLDGKIIRASRAAEQMANGAVLLRQFDALFYLRSEAKDYTFAEIASTVKRGGNIAGQSLTARTHDGRTLEVMLSASPLAGGASEALGCIIVISDVSGLKRAEEALRESESRLRTLGDNLPECAIYRYSQDREGTPRFEFISAGIERLTGILAAEIMQDAAAIDSTILPEDFARLAVATAESRDQLSRLEIEVRHTHRRTGETRWSLLRSMPSRRWDGSTIWEGIQLDITDRKQAQEEMRAKEEQLRQAQKMESIGVLAGGVAHDFNNLLTGVLGHASLVLDTMPAWDRNRAGIEALINAANRAADLTRQLLAYSGKGRFYVEQVSVSEAVREMLDLLRCSIPANVSIELDLARQVAAIEADAGQIHQVVMNLVLNASEAIGDRPGRIIIRTQTRSVDSALIAQAKLDISPGTYVSLEVQDTGSGMDEKTKSRIFEPFFTTKFQGRGLGLAAVHGIVRAHKGAVLVYTHPGRGSSFTVLLPAATTGVSQRAEITSNIQELYGEGTILVADDEEVVRSVAKTTLERFGYRVLLAKNGIEAVEIFSRFPDEIGAVLLDLTMPLMSGEETFERMRAIRPDVPVVLSSGYNHIEVIKRFTGKGLAGFIGKPYSAAALVTKMKAVCAGSEA